MATVHSSVFAKESPTTLLGTRVRRADPSVRPAPDPRPNTITHRGVIQVIDGANGTVLGYVSKTSLKRAQLRHRPNIDSALVVTFETDLTGSGTKLNLAMTVRSTLASTSNSSQSTLRSELGHGIQFVGSCSRSYGHGFSLVPGVL